MPKRIVVPISTARSRLFQLADLVRKSDGEAVVVLEQRGEPEGVAMVREARLTYLEERVTQLDRQQAAPFALAGSLSAAVSDATLEDALRLIRLEWGTRSQPAETAAAVPGPRRRARRRRI